MKHDLEDHRFELIKAHALDPEHSPLTETDQEIVNRVMSMAKLMDKQPIQKNAVAIHMQKYKNIGRTAAYEDYRLARKLFNTQHTFDYDFWHAWMLNDIVRNIDRARKSDDPAAWRVIAMEHANLIKAIGEKPVKEIDPKLIEEHTYIVPIQINNTSYNFDLEKLLDLPEKMRKKFTDALVSEIDDSEATEIMNS
jgi:hypothetical protein